MAEQIRADYQQLQQVAARFTRQAEQIDVIRRQLKASMERLRGQWVGRGSDAFFSEMQQATLPAVDRLHVAFQAANRTTLQIATVIQQAEREAAALFRSDGASTAAGIPGVAQVDQVGGGGPGSQEVRDLWSSLSDEERAAALQSMSDEILRQYGLDPVPVIVQDLPDPPNGDLFGSSSDDGIFIDSDNLADPNILNTLAHEARHEVQWQMARRATPNGWNRFLRWLGVQETPTWPHHGITEETAREWADNFDNYIEAEDDPTGYGNQPIEVDARDYGDQYLRNLTEEDLRRHIPTPILVTPGPVPELTPTPTPAGTPPATPPATPPPPLATPGPPPMPGVGPAPSTPTPTPTTPTPP